MEKNLYDLDLLRRKIACIPGKIGMTLGILLCMLNSKWESVTDSVFATLGLLLIIYGFVSYFMLLFINSHNLGFVVAVATITGIALIFGCKTSTVYIIVLLIMIGAIVLDVLHILSYIKLKKELISLGITPKKLTRNDRRRYELESHLSGSSFSNDLFENCDTKEEYDARLKMLKEIYKDKPEVLERANKEYLKRI